jgi:hypothetical protein
MTRHLRAPNGVVQDGLEFFGARKPYYDPAKITVPTLLVLAEWDRDRRPICADAVSTAGKRPGKRMVTLAEGTSFYRDGRPRGAVPGSQAFSTEQTNVDERLAKGLPRPRSRCLIPVGPATACEGFKLRQSKAHPGRGKCGLFQPTVARAQAGL